MANFHCFRDLAWVLRPDSCLIEESLIAVFELLKKDMNALSYHIKHFRDDSLWGNRGNYYLGVPHRRELITWKLAKMQLKGSEIIFPYSPRKWDSPWSRGCPQSLSVHYYYFFLMHPVCSQICPLSCCTFWLLYVPILEVWFVSKCAISLCILYVYFQVYHLFL